MGALDVKEAVMYPFVEGRWKNAVLLPGAVTLVLTIAAVILAFLAKILNLPDKAFSWPADVASQLFSSGYMWLFYANFIQHGRGCEPPDILESWKDILIGGLKLMVPSLVIGLLFGIYAIVGIILLPLMAPGWHLSMTSPELLLSSLLNVSILIPLSLYLIAPLVLIAVLHPYYIGLVIRSSQTRKLSDLWNIQGAIDFTQPRYGQVLIASAYLLGVGLVYGLGMILLMITVIGLIAVPFAAFAVGVTASHLYAQAFEDD